jgi:hypothetical protein
MRLQLTLYLFLFRHGLSFFKLGSRLPLPAVAQELRLS